MSGPKSGCWRVVPAGQGISAAAAQELLGNYLDCILKFRKQLESLQRRHPELQLHLEVDNIEAETLPAIEAIAAELNNRYEIYIRLRDEIERVTSLIQAQEQAQKMLRTFEEERSKKLAKGATVKEEQLENVKSKVEILLAAVDVQVPTDIAEEIRKAADLCLNAQELESAELYLSDLRIKVRRNIQVLKAKQRDEAERRNRDAAAARGLLQRLESFSDQANPSVLSDLVDVSLGEAALTESLRRDAETQITTAERALASNILKKTLEQLGYTVQDGFATLFSAGGSNFFQRPSWSEHYVRITVDPERQRLSLDMVRYGNQGENDSEQNIRDKEMQIKWCEEVDGLVTRLASEGLSVDLTKRLAPGEVNLQLVSDQRIKPLAKKGQRQQKQAKQL